MPSPLFSKEATSKLQELVGCGRDNASICNFFKMTPNLWPASITDDADLEAKVRAKANAFRHKMNAQKNISGNYTSRMRTIKKRSKDASSTKKSGQGSFHLQIFSKWLDS
jgi:hypothetical protein